MSEKPGLRDIYENFDEIEGLDEFVEDYEIRPVEGAETDYQLENVYEISLKMGNQRLPEEGSVMVGLNHFSNESGDSLRVSFKDLEGLDVENLITVPIRQFFSQNYDIDLSDYSNRSQDNREIPEVGESEGNREFTVRDKSENWTRNVPLALRQAGLNYTDSGASIRIDEGEYGYILTLDSEKIDLERKEDNRGGKTEDIKEDIDNLEDLRDALENEEALK